MTYFAKYLLLFLLYEAGNGSSAGAPDLPNIEADIDPVKLFQSLLIQRRKEHKEALKSLLALNDYAKQYNMIEIVATKAFQVLEDTQVQLRDAGYIPGMDFPTDQTVMLALGQNIEKTMFFGEILLHLPDITHKVINSKKSWQFLLTWGIFFASQSNFLDDGSKKLISLMSQEMELAEKDPNYVNPYRNVHRRPSAVTSPNVKTKEKKKKNFKKGPQFSRNFGDL